MRALDYLSLAFGNLRRRKLRTFLTVGAVVIGATSVIVMLALVLGAKRVAVQQIESMDALTLVNVSGNPELGDEAGLFDAGGRSGPDDQKIDADALAAIRRIPHVDAAQAVVRVEARAIQLEGHDKRRFANVTSYDPEAPVFSVPLVAGRDLQAGDMAAVVVSLGELRSLGFRGNAEEALGTNLLLLFDEWAYYNDWTGDPPQPDPSRSAGPSATPELLPIPAQIVGVAGGVDGAGTRVPFAWAERLATRHQWGGGPDTEGPTIVTESSVERDGYSGILARVDLTANVESVAGAVERMGFGVATAQGMLDAMGKGLLVLGLIAGAIGGVILFVASMGIVNTMVMATYERTREVGIMRACGATRRAIVRLFSVEASLIGLLGGAIALAGSFVLAKIANVLINRVTASQSLPISDVIGFPLWLVGGVLALTSFIGLAAGVLPARRASRLDPVEALRYE